MSGGSEEHNCIVGNIYASLLAHLRGSECQIFSADMKVKISLAENDSDFFYYPDVMVTCDPQDTEKYYKSYPCLIVEVLSLSTKDIDKQEKLLNYQSLESLQEYVLVSKTGMKVAIYRRLEVGCWSGEILGKEDCLKLNSVGLTLTMTDIYDEVLIG
ncbi:MAG: Uma2 family endonuclease [Okeania sp. SIO2C9]|nr:Uma2 family endonuclease [Okeania sp. SIO2C9]